MFFESSTGRWAVLQLLCCPCKQGELSENILQNIFHNLTPQTVHDVILVGGRGAEPKSTCPAPFVFGQSVDWIGLVHSEMTSFPSLRKVVILGEGGRGSD